MYVVCFYSARFYETREREREREMLTKCARNLELERENKSCFEKKKEITRAAKPAKRRKPSSIYKLGFRASRVR